jgi:hypothetical protein
MKAKTVIELGCACEACRQGSQGCSTYPDGKIPIGTVIEGPNAWRLVRHGCAVPADEECERVANVPLEKRQAMQQHYKMVALGIHPDDYEKFEAGEIEGYVDGEPIPGPYADESEGGIILP